MGSQDSLDQVFEGLGSGEAKVKYGCSKALRQLAESDPQLLLPHFGRLVEMLEGDNTFLKWDAIRAIACVAAVDPEDRFERIFKRYFAPIPGPVLITAANTIGAAARIGCARPQWADRIARELLKTETARYRTAECRNVALGQAIESLDAFFPHLRRKKAVVEFVRRQRRNRRSSTRRKAERFLARWAA